MKVDPDQLPRLRALFALRRISPAMQSDVLSGGHVAAKTGIKVSNTIKFSENVSVERDRLFTAFQRAVDGGPSPEIVDAKGAPLKAKIEMQDDAGIVIFEDKRLRFAEAALLSAKAEQRRRIVANALSKYTLSREARDKIEALGHKNEFSHQDFFSTTVILSASQESFQERLRQQAETKTLSRDDFVPTQTQYWDNLIGAYTTSTTLAEFIENELLTEHAERLSRDPANAIVTASLWFVAPSIAAHAFAKPLSDDVAYEAVTRISTLLDPFALAGALDVCADRLSTSNRFGDIGAEILVSLLSDETQLRAQFATFATSFVLSTAYLAEHETLRKKPVFWRRLAASAHASLVTRILGASTEDENSLLSWAMRLSGKTFYISVLNDARVQPRWRPDWIDPTILVADVYGRIRASLGRVPAARMPARWQEMADKLEMLIQDKNLTAATCYPAILEGERRDPTQVVPSNPAIEEVYEDVLGGVTIEKFLRLTNIVYMLGLEPSAHNAAMDAVQLLRTEAKPVEPDLAHAVLSLAAYAAAQNSDATLSDSVAQACIERMVVASDKERMLHSVITLLECAAANNDEEKANPALAQRLESLAFVAPSTALPELLDLLRTLQKLNNKLAPALGRAVATASLGRPAGPIA